MVINSGRKDDGPAPQVFGGGQSLNGLATPLFVHGNA